MTKNSPWPGLPGVRMRMQPDRAAGQSQEKRMTADIGSEWIAGAGRSVDRTADWPEMQPRPESAQPGPENVSKQNGLGLGPGLPSDASGGPAAVALRRNGAQINTTIETDCGKWRIREWSRECSIRIPVQCTLAPL